MARDMDKPVLIHIRTYKGRGYKYAENAPSVYHGLAAFDREKGAGEAIAKGFSHAFGETMCTIAGVNEKLCAVTAAMESGTGLTDFRENTAAVSLMSALRRNTPSRSAPVWRAAA